MKMLHLSYLLFALLLLRHTGWSHEDFTSNVTLDLKPNGIRATILVSAGDLARESPSLEPKMLMDTAILEQEEASIGKKMLSRLILATAAGPLPWSLETITADPEKEKLRLDAFFAADAPPVELQVSCALFPEEPIHRTYLVIYRDDTLLRQETFDSTLKVKNLQLQAPRSKLHTALEFVGQGMHHIFIGFDHILFVLGLMLLGGTLKRLLLVTTAFTIAHSVTLVLASLKLITPPAEIIEPAIALSIVFIGIHAFLHRAKSDHRISLAFVLGLLHGFGFAGVLQDLELPKEAFALSLAGFNIGVELGQAAILLLTVPSMALLLKKLPRQSAALMAAATLAITAIGSYWFTERVLQANEFASPRVSESIRRAPDVGLKKFRLLA